MWVWLLDGLVLYLLVITVPLLGGGCVAWYVVTHGIAFASRPAPHQGMKERMARLKAEQKANDEKYEQVEVDRLNQQWQDSSHERLSVPALIAVAGVLVLIGWGMSYA